MALLTKRIKQIRKPGFMGFLISIYCGRWDLKKLEIRKYAKRKAFSVSLSCVFKNVFKGIGKYYFISSFLFEIFLIYGMTSEKIAVIHKF